MNLTQALRLAGRPNDPGSISESSDRISWETVSATTFDGKAVVRGATIPCSGNFVPFAGQVVPVLWRRGQPNLVLGHRARRAQFPHIIVPTGNGLIEELIVGNFDKTVNDVWYRNYGRFEKLNVAGQLGGNQAQEVKWGYDGKSFVVACSSGWWYVFTMDRDPSTVEGQWSPKLAWSGQPLVSNTALTTVTYKYTKTKTSSFWLPHVDQTATLVYSEEWGWHWETTFTFSWDSPMDDSGSASLTTSISFGLADLLAGKIVDANGEHNVEASILDWFLDGDGHLKFLIKVAWDDFIFAVSGSNGGNLHHTIGAGGNGMSGWDEGFSLSGAYTGALGVMKQSDHSTVDEAHIFIYDAAAGNVAWATAALGPNFGIESVDWWCRIYEHWTTHVIGGDNPGDWESYYGGASGGSFNDTKYNSYPASGDVRSKVVSSTGTGQLFDPQKLAVLAGPYIQNPGGLTASATAGLLGGGNYVIPGDAFIYSVESSYYSQADVRLWHYRVQVAQLFQANDAPRLFLVMERYPFIPGTAYINDIPQVGVFIIDPKTGALVRTLRDWQYGLNGASLLLGNAHRIIWMLSAPWYSPTTTLYTTDLLTGQEVFFTADQWELLLRTKSFLLSPDFVWDYDDPKQFYSPDKLPALISDDVLKDLARLFEVGLTTPGSIRAANNESILDPLGRYRAT